ncbi:DUF2497 domain-containing protein [bacterium NHP-B]|nr:DUF2497 domain-containing protein [bacterium NHP-B]
MSDEEATSIEDILASIRRVIGTNEGPVLGKEGEGQGASSNVLELQEVVEGKASEKDEAQMASAPAMAAGMSPNHASSHTSSHMSAGASSTKSVKNNVSPLMSTLSRQEKLAEGFEVFLESTLEKIVREFLSSWIDKNMPTLAEKILKDQMRAAFEARCRKEG